MTLGERIAQLRKARQMSQEELAERMDVSRQAVSKWENDQSRPDTDNLIGLAQLFEVDINELVDSEKGEAETGRAKLPIIILGTLTVVFVCIAAVFCVLWQMEEKSHDKTLQLLQEAQQINYWDSVTMTKGLLQEQVELTDTQKVQLSQLVWSQEFTPWSQTDENSEFFCGGYVYSVDFRQDGICYHWVFTSNCFTYTVTTENGDSILYKYSPNHDFITILCDRFC